MAVVGTGATGVQVIAEIADKVSELTVYQRSPNWCAPLNNGPIDESEMAEIKSNYGEIFDQLSKTPGSFLHGPDYRAFDDVTEEDRLAFWNRLYESPGFDAITGAFDRIAFTGVDGQSLANKWKDGPMIYLGGAPAYRERLAEVEENGYEGFNVN